MVGDWRKAAAVWEKALSLDPQDWRAHSGLARTAKKGGQLERARLHFTCVTVIRPGTAEAEEAANELKK